jgi:hypothetical protein
MDLRGIGEEIRELIDFEIATFGFLCSSFLVLRTGNFIDCLSRVQ